MNNQGAFHEDYETRVETRTSSDRAFGIIFSAVFSIIAFWPVISDDSVRWWALTSSAMLFVISVARPSLLSPLNKMWTFFGVCLHRTVNPIIMGLIFYFVVTPIGVTMRLFKKTPLDLKFEPKAKSYWIERTPPGPPAENMKNQF